MRLYLSSFRLGNQPQRLVDLVKGSRQAAVIVNACDLLSEDERNVCFRRELVALESLGFSVAELDLRKYFANRRDQDEIGVLLATCGLVWVSGGNSFVLRRAIKASGFDKIIRDFLEHDSIVYGGYSAGIDILTPSLRGIEMVDDPYAVPIGYDSPIIWDCLGLLSYTIAPHYKSNHPESANIDKSVQYYIDNHVLFRALRDGEVIVVDGQREEVLS